MAIKRDPRGNIVAIMVGAGAVENSWAPVIRALQPYYPLPLTQDGANSILARAVYLLRWYASLPGEDAKMNLRLVKDFVLEVKKRICEELIAAEASGELHIRPQFYELIDRLIVPRSHGLLFITTNWDTVAERAAHAHLDKKFKGQIHALHIHGSTKKEDTLYLPTEVTREQYRSREEDQEIGGIHGAIMRGLENARWGVVYGLSMSPLDAELCQTFAAGWDNRYLERLDIVVPDHEVVAHRINLLLSHKQPVAVYGFNPGNLAQSTNYTVQVPSRDAGV
jgi:hypothetical protein